jgi:hypothetical protein
MGAIELLILLGLGAGTIGFIAKSNRRKRLEAAFYQLLRQQDSCVSLIQLMAISQVSSQTAKVLMMTVIPFIVFPSSDYPICWLMTTGKFCHSDN